MKNHIAFLLAVMIAVTGCAGGAVDKSGVSSPEALGGTYTMLILREGFPIEGQFAAVLDDPSDNVSMALSPAATVHETREGVTIGQGLAIMEPLFKKHCAYSGQRVSRLSLGSEPAGYEIAPLHANTNCDKSPLITVRYTRAGDRTVNVSLSVLESRTSPMRPGRD